MTTLSKSHSTISQQSCPHQQNRVASRKHRHTLKVTRSLLLFTPISKCYWAEVVLIAVLLINITPSSIVAALSPYTRLHGHSFDYSLLHTFGCVCFILSLLRNEINYPSKLVNVFFLDIALLIKNVNFMSPLPTSSNFLTCVTF